MSFKDWEDQFFDFTAEMKVKMRLQWWKALGNVRSIHLSIWMYFTFICKSSEQNKNGGVSCLKNNKWAAARQNQRHALCAQRRLAQSDQSLRCPKDTSGPLPCLLPIERTAKTLIRLGGGPGWFASSQGAQFISLILSCCGSFVFFKHDIPPFSFYYELVEVRQNVPLKNRRLQSLIIEVYANWNFPQTSK